MSSSRITYNKGSYRISLSKKFVDDSGLQVEGSTDSIPIKIETSKKLGCLIIHDFKFRELPNPSIKELPIDRAIAEGYFDNDELLSGKHHTFRKGFVDLSHLPEEAAKDPKILQIKKEADVVGRRVLDAFKEFDRKTKDDIKKYKQLHSSFKYWVSQHLENTGKRPRTCDTNKPSKYDKL